MPTNSNRSQLNALTSLNFPDNTSQLISPADLRQWLEDGTASFVTQKDTSRLENAIYENEGSALAAAGTVNLGSATGNFLHITGTGTISYFGTCPEGARFILVFDGVCTLVYNATSLILPGTANITTAANDCCMIVSEGSGNWRVVGYFPIAGGTGGGTVTSVTATSPLASTGGNAPDISIQQASGSQNGYLSSSDFNTFTGKQDALSAGTGISLASNTVTNTAPDQTVALTPGTGIGITGTYPNFTIANTAPSSGGTVTTTGSPSSGQITKFSGATSITNATAGTDYIAPPSGTAILKANSGGALANATAGTDYVAPGAATGSGLTMATSRLLGRTSASTGAIEEISLTTTGTSGAATLSGGVLNIPQYSGGSGSGTVNSGTFNRLAYYATNPSGTAVSELPTAGSAGQILQSNGTGSAPSWVNAPAATLTIGTSIVSGATAGRLLLTTTSGANQVLNQDSNLNYDTSNDRLGIGVASPAARLDLALPTGTNPSIILAPSSAVTISGTTNGSIWCDTVASNTSLTMRKDSAYTKILTLDRNPDLATSGSGVLQADANGTLSKGADLTALGIFAQTAENQLTNSIAETSIIGTITGTKTLPANFFGVGKTITIYVSGQYSQTNGSQTCTIRVSIGGTATVIASVILNHGNQITSANFWEASFTITCYSTGTTGTVRGCGKSMLLTDTTSRTWYMDADPANSAVTINTTIANTLEVTGQWSGTATTANDLRTSIAYANYIN